LVFHIFYLLKYYKFESTFARQVVEWLAKAGKPHDPAEAERQTAEYRRRIKEAEKAAAPPPADLWSRITKKEAAS